MSAINNDNYKRYLLEAGEARACGYEFPTYQEWSGKGPSLREKAEEKIGQRLADGTSDLF